MRKHKHNFIPFTILDKEGNEKIQWLCVKRSSNGDICAEELVT